MQQSPSLAGVSVLVVEDDPPSSKLVTVLLTDVGAHVRAVASAEEAIETMTTFHPRVIILDLVLPRMGGLLFLEQLRKDPQNLDIVVIVVTALNGPELERRTLAAGCAEYLRKPIDADSFVAVVAKHVGASR